MKILTWPVVAGAALGIVAPLLTYNGNPGNMGFCAACFLRDTADRLDYTTPPHCNTFAQNSLD